MKKLDIKHNVDEMIFQVCKYIKSADLSEKEDSEIKVEEALSLLTATIDFTDKPDENLEYISKQILEISTIIFESLLDVSKDVITGNVDESRFI